MMPVELSLFGGDPIPRETRGEVNTLQAEFDALRSNDSARLDRMKQYREENERSREVDQRAVRGQARDGDYGMRAAVSDEPSRHNISLPFGMALTVKHAYRIAGRLPDVIVDRREESPLEHYRSDTIEKLWWGIVHASSGESQIATGAWDGSQLGAACFEPYFDVETQMARFRAVDPSGVVVVRGLDDPHRFQRIYRFWNVPVATLQSEYRDHQFDGIPVQVNDIESTHKVGMTPMATVVEMRNARENVRFALGAKEPEQRKNATPLFRWQHGLGFTPFVVIPNIGPERDVWGWADYEFVRALTFYIPQLLSREADIIRMVANGAMIEKGTGQDPNQVKKVLGVGGVLPSRRDGVVEPIAAPDVPAFEAAHADRALELFKMLGFAPDAAWGGSDTRSGADRSLQMQPLVEFTAMKETNWAAGLKRLAEMCFRLMEQKQISSATIRGARPARYGTGRRAFQPFKLGPDQRAGQQDVMDEYGIEDTIELPRTMTELFDGDYCVRFVWQNRVDVDDPAYVTSEVNKFAQAVQSLTTTLERLGVVAPEDEIKLIESESDRLPWLRQGMIRLIQAQLSGQNQGGGTGEVGQGNGGGNPDPTQGLDPAMAMFGTKDGAGGALGADAATAALPGGIGTPFGGA